MRRVDLDIFFFFFFSLPLSKRSAKLWKSTSRPSPSPSSLLPQANGNDNGGGGSVSQKFRRDFNRREKKRFNNPAQMDVRRMIEHPRIRVPGTTNFIIRVLANFHTKRCCREGRRREGRTEKYRDYRFVFHGASGKLCTVYE